jgi:presenilin-like A22 family membrane protease
MAVRAAKHVAGPATLPTTLLMGVLGAFSAYMITVAICCIWLMPNSNQCGLPAVFIGAPIGFIVGGIAGFLHARPPRK